MGGALSTNPGVAQRLESAHSALPMAPRRSKGGLEACKNWLFSPGLARERGNPFLHIGSDPLAPIHLV